MKKFLGRFFAVVGGFVSISILIGVLTVMISGKKDISLPEKAVLELDLSGYIPETNAGAPFPFNLAQRGPNLYDIIRTMDVAKDDPQIKGLLVNLGPNSLGLAQTQDLRAAIARFRAKGKFALIHTDTFGDLVGGTLPYYLASAFDEIALQNMGNLAFVGLSMEMPFARRFLDEWQVLPRFAQREEFKGIMETFTREHMSEASQMELTALLKDIMDQIIKDVAKERELGEDEVTLISQGAPIFHAEEAKRRGLLDQVAYYDTFAAYARKKAGPQGDLFSFEDYTALTKNRHTFKENGRGIALVFASGKIQRRKGTPSVPFMPADTMASDDMTDIFDDILDSDHPKPAAIVVRIDSPGGAPTPSETIWRLLMRAREAKIPVVVSMGNTAASGGYWIATAADKIVAQGATITGSIGVAGGKIVLEQLWRRFGVEWGAVSTGPYASAASPNQDFTHEQWQNFNESLDYTYSFFLHRVSKGRNLSPEKTHELAKGRVWTGRQALENGLVDAVGDLHSAIEMAQGLAGLDKNTPVPVVLYPKSTGLGGLFGALPTFVEGKTLQGILLDVLKDASQELTYPTYRAH